MYKIWIEIVARCFCRKVIRFKSFLKAFWDNSELAPCYW